MLEDLIKVCAEVLKIDDLPNEELQLIASDLGIEAIIKLAMKFSGIYIYIPKDLKKKIKKAYVLRCFDGTNAKQLARKLDISERSVYDWVHEEDKVRLQTNLFGS